ncbi:protein TAPETUM DETERMINANT 1 [Cinnamomum micranthum f. kanehirae]|uniref:Protein TAPETUM DETERMINANT 1 n=1 Tax=Cinnamomum micranthum f. kanehirae TaxID=337451 RepID=A0A3S3N2H0_9MAGN|nr:protein TAPETUM DETERMINANT 1 [Cinnamomum micranthum f. kanehirae]
MEIILLRALKGTTIEISKENLKSVSISSVGFRCSKATSEHIHQSPTEFLLWKSQISVWTVEDRVSDLYSGCNLLGFGRLKFEFLSGIKRIFSDPKPSFGLQSMERKRFSKLRSIRTVSLRLIFLSLVAVAVSAGFVAFHFGTMHQQTQLQVEISSSDYQSRTSPHRKLLGQGGGDAEPERAGPGFGLCKHELRVYQGQTTPLPSGIPTYTVNVLNVCQTRCDISEIHLRCGRFSSARLINPKVFRRLSLNDCLVNDGKPIRAGGSVSFQYADTFSYPMQIGSYSCSNHN